MTTVTDMPLVNQLGRTIFMVLLVELCGLVVALFVGAGLSWFFRAELSAPFNTILIVDYGFITISAILAQLAAPSPNTGNITTSFVVATSTLAPLAVYASKTLRDKPDGSNVLMAIVRGRAHEWSPETLTEFRLIVSIAVVLCTLVAIWAAFTLRRLSAGTLQLPGVVNKAPGTFLRTVLLSVSVLLFGGYTFLIYEWTPSSIVIPDIATEIPAKAVALWALGFFVVIGSLLLIASMVARCADRFLDAIPAGSAFGDILSKVFRSITPAVLLLLLVIVPLGVFLQSLSSDKVAVWVPPAFAADLARLLGTFGVSASDLAYSLFLFSGTVAVFPVLVMLIGAGRAGTTAIVGKIKKWFEEVEPEEPEPPPPDPFVELWQQQWPKIRQTLFWLVAIVAGLWLPMSIYPHTMSRIVLTSQIAIILVAIYAVTLMALQPAAEARMSRRILFMYGLCAAVAFFWNFHVGSSVPMAYAAALCFLTFALLLHTNPTRSTVH